MAVSFDTWDALPKGTGYQDPGYPTTDAAPDKVTNAQHVPDSFNDAMNFQVVSIATEAIDGPTNPAPYWNSGHGEDLVILDGGINK